jgi:glutamine synthetase
LNVGQLAKNSGNAEIFPIIMAAILKAVNDYGDLMRLAISSPGNDFRLGACEAPPAIVSVYLGEDMTKYLESYIKGENKPYSPNTKFLNMGASALPQIEVPAEDRNRTSPFPYGGHRFEFRAVGSSQNVSLVNTVLATIVAKSFKDFADAIQAGQTPCSVAQKALQDSWKNVFNGNGYDPANQAELTKKGLWRIDSGVDAITRFTVDKNVKLFEELQILTSEECSARQSVLLNHYIGTVEIEALTFIDMIQQHIIPACKASGVGPLAELNQTVQRLKENLAAVHHATNEVEKARLARTLRLEAMVEARQVTDAAEEVVPANEWTLATYKELLFLDQHVGSY